MYKGWFHHPNTHWLTVHLWQNGISQKDGDRPAGEDRRRERPGCLDALFSCQAQRRTDSPPADGLWWYCLRQPCALRGAAPLELSFPAQYIPADANGGLCIGRSCTDALGAWGPSATNKLHRVYTGALLAITIGVQKQGLNVTSIGAILCS